MSTTSNKSPGNTSPLPPTFSYAQAAKGRAPLSSAAALLAQSVTGATTPPKESIAETGAEAQSSLLKTAVAKSPTEEMEKSEERTPVAESLAEDAKPKSSFTEAEIPNGDALISPSSPKSHIVANDVNGTKDEDANSTTNNTSLSTSEEQSWASNTSEKPSETPADAETTKQDLTTENGKSEESTKSEELEKSAQLITAPIPVVNIWQQRKEAQAAKVRATSQGTPATAPIKSTPRSASTEATVSKPSVVAATPSVEAEKPANTQVTTKEKRRANEGKGREDHSSKKSGARPKAAVEKEKEPVATTSLPPVDDGISWPTPELAQGEEKKKSQDKGDKVEKPLPANSAGRSHGKEKWVTVPFTPTPVFQTPLPIRKSGTKAGRGGREGGRGGSQAANASGSNEKPANTSTTPVSPGNKENGERGRAQNSATRAASLPPSKSNKRSSSGGNGGNKDGRKFVPPAVPERRKDGELPKNQESEHQPYSNYNQGRRMSTATQPEYSHKNRFEGSRPTKPEPTLTMEQDSKNVEGNEKTQIVGNEAHSHPRQSGSDRRASEFSRDSATFGAPRERGEGRPERGRGGFRGARGGGSNGFTNSPQHPPHPYSAAPHTKDSPTFPYSKSSSFASPSQSHGFHYNQSAPQSRNFRPNNRAQSIPNYNMTGRFPAPHPGSPPPLTPIQTQMGAPFEFPMHAMTAVPYQPYIDNSGSG